MKSLKKYLFLLLIPCFIFFVSILIFSSNNIISVKAETIALTGSGTKDDPYLIRSLDDLIFFQEAINGKYENDEFVFISPESGKEDYQTAYYKLISSIDLSSIDFWTPVGINRTFNGNFNGNGKTITGISLKNDDNIFLGFFAQTYNANIYDLGIEVNVVLSEQKNGNEIKPNDTIIVGGLIGKANYTNVDSCYCDFILNADRVVRLKESEAQKFYTKIEGSEEIVGGQSTFDYQTYLYSGELISGALIGQSNNSIIKNSYSIPTITLFQDGINVVSTYIGGIVGVIDNGELYNVYVAPSNEYISQLSSSGGNINSLDSKYSQIKINSSKGDLSSVVFGGIVGYGMGANLNIYNTMFFGTVASLSPNKIVTGAIVGVVPSNVTFQPLNIRYAKFLNLSSPSTDVIYFSSGIGNATQTNFINFSEISSINSMPTESLFFEWSWNEFRPWDFEETWKNVSIYTSSGGYYFPSLQNFAFFTISISGSKEVIYSSSNKYAGGYYTLELEGKNEKSYQYLSGQEVKIIAKFYYEDGNQYRDFKNYFDFTGWILGEYSINNFEVPNEEALFVNYITESGNGPYTISIDPETGTTTLSFIASSGTEGTYDVGIKGKEVKVNINMIYQDEDIEMENLGQIVKTESNIVENYNKSFSFIVGEYLNSSAVTLTANDKSSGNYVFANLWRDANDSSQTLITRNIIIELNNENKSSNNRIYPKVIKTDNGLECSVNVYYTDSMLKINTKITGNGTVKINGQEANNENGFNFINGTKITLEAYPKEGMEFEGWYIGEKLISKDKVYEYTVNSSTVIEAKFKEAEKNNGLETWIIIIIVVVPTIIIGVAIYLVIRLKKKSSSSYRKNYRF